MKISVDISLYPLNESYRQPVLDFIGRLETHPDLLISRNSMSTTIYGDYTLIMPILNTEMHTTLQALPESVFVIKLSGGCH
ncbi:hypothetical protein [Thiomicrorhabdus sp.]|uniref:hypothetical protein n=1 Tax=Thiomicrorhabdus sp. TaxID=2039724 RepID=UPI0029C8D146|nr:hypothetical protein [Thiomicrorhabdus sp.]